MKISTGSAPKAAPKPAPKPASTPKPAASSASASKPAGTKPTSTGNTGSSSNAGKSGSSSPSKRTEDKVTLGRAEDSSSPSSVGSESKVDDLKKGLEENYGVKEDAPKDPRSKFFKDPEHLEKLDAAKTELTEAREGTHQELEELKSQQGAEKDQALSKEIDAKEKAHADLEKAESEYSEAQKQAQERVQNQQADQAQAQADRDTTRGELESIKKPGEQSAAYHVDRVDRAKDALDEKKEWSAERAQAADQAVSDQRSQIEDRYGAELEKNPQLRDDMERYRELNETLDNDELSGSDRRAAVAEKSRIRNKLNGVTDGDGNRLSNDFGSLVNAEDKAESIKSSDKRTVDRYQQRYDQAKKEANSLYGKTPGIGEKINDYRSAKQRVQETTPEGVRQKNAEELDAARTRVQEAKETKSAADADFNKAEEVYNQGPGAEHAKELQTKQSELVESLEKRVDDLSTIKSTDLSDAIRKSPGFGYSSEYDGREFKLDGDTLKYNNGYGKTDFTARVGEDGGIQIDGVKKEGDTTTTSSTHRVQNADGSWRSDNHTVETDSPRNTTTETLKENEDGSSVRTTRRDSKTSDEYFQSRTAKGADGSEASESQYRRYGQDGITTSRKSPDGREESLTRLKDIEDSSWSEIHRQKDAQGVETTTTKQFSEREWANHSNVEGASWLWKHSPQNLRNAIGDDATYGTYSETTTVREPGKSAETTSQMERERWTSADGRRTLDAQRGQKGMPDTWTYTTKDGDKTRSQTFIRGSEDTSISESYTDKDGFQVTKTTEDFRDMAEKVKEASGGDMAATGHTIQKLMDVASVEDLNKLIKDHPELKEITESDNFKRFLDQVGDGKFSLAFQDSEQTLTDGKESFTTSLNATAADGTSLTYVSGQEGGGVQYHQPGEKGEEAFTATTLFDDRGNRLESASDGSASLVSFKGARQILKDAETVGTAAWRGPRALAHVPEMIGDLTKMGKIGKSGRLMTALGNLDNQFQTNFGKGLDKVALGLNAFHTVSSAYQGKWGEAAGGLAGTATGIGAIAGHYGQGWKAGQYVDKLGKTANMWDEGATLAGVSRTAQIGKALGAAGAVYQLGTGIYDITQERYARGALGIAGAGGTALAIWGGASWAGPVGWGLAAVATAGIYTIDYVDGNAIAEPQIPLN